MNTKQLWQALTNNNITEKIFDGVFPVDKLSHIKRKPELIICNTDPSYKSGQHWLLFFFHNDVVDYYDSLGEDIGFYGKDFINFIKKFAKSIQSTTYRSQPRNTSLCGHYCLYFAYYRCKGFSMNEIMNLLKNVNDIEKVVVDLYDIDLDTESNELFQICTNCK